MAGRRAILALVLIATVASRVAAAAPTTRPIELRAWGIPGSFNVGPDAEARGRIIDAFEEKYPWIHPVRNAGLRIPGGTRSQDMVPFMQIAGDIAPDVMYVNFRQSSTYIEKKLLLPLDEYVEAMAGVKLSDGSAMPLEEFLAALKDGATWSELNKRVPQQCWDVMRRECPYGGACPYREEARVSPLTRHEHVWAFPVGPSVMGLTFNKAMFAEHADEGVEQRGPKDWDEMLRWAKLLTRPERSEYGINIPSVLPGWYFLNFLYSAGGEVVKKNEKGEWYCVLDSEEAVEAAYFMARLYLEPITRDGRVYRGVVTASQAEQQSLGVRTGMAFEYLDDRNIATASVQGSGIAPVPKGATGKRGSEFNSHMCGIFAGLKDGPERRDAAWKYIEFYDGIEARRIRTEKMVSAGLGPLVKPDLLREFNEHGRYGAVLAQVPRELEETYRIAFAAGIPEPYGKNCQYVYDEMSKPLGAIFRSAIVRNAIDRGDAEAGKREVRRILKQATLKINVKMLGNLTQEERTTRNAVAWSAIGGVIVVFAWMWRRVGRAFRRAIPRNKGADFRRFTPHRWAWLMLLPALASIALWMYWPLLRGSLIAFQDYSVVGDNQWVGAGNFAAVLYDSEFWYSLRVSLAYAFLFMLFGFFAPVGLAMLLQEVPRGTVAFRTIYYLPAVLSGVVVIFLWKSFYSPQGLVNQIINGFIHLANWLPGVRINLVSENWLENDAFALLACLLPTIWAGIGPGCLIYLAALKTVPEELYEAADIDGAGIAKKVTSVALPSIKSLIMINFIGAMIGAIRGSGGFILAMTGGGPYSEQGGATEVIGLKLFYTTFGHLNFGGGAAMAWVLGSMLIGFTVIQLQRLSKLEFRTAEKV